MVCQVEYTIQKINPYLWFDDNAKEAANFYTSMFKNSKIESINYYGDTGGKASGKPVWYKGLDILRWIWPTVIYNAIINSSPN
jgi:3-demethylubiquinone-9 3-methyltransferase